MKISMDNLVHGEDIEVEEGIVIRQPALKEIRRRYGEGLGFEKYHQFLNVMAMSSKDLQEALPEELPQEIREKMDVYTYFMVYQAMRDIFVDALRFYTGGPVEYLADKGIYVVQDKGIIHPDNFDIVRGVILEINGIKSEEIEEKSVTNKKAQEILNKINKGRKNKRKKTKANNAEGSIQNIISAISAKSSQYNMSNIYELTVWQLYNQFGHININYQMEVYSLRWAAYGKDKFDFTTWYKTDK